MTDTVPTERTISTHQWIGFIGMVFGMFMSILDIQIVNSSLQQIQAGLSATVDEITWIQTSYLIAEVIMIPLSGWLARAFSTRYLFVFSCAGFTIMSFACACAWDLNSMIVFRTFQGFFGGAMIPSVFAVIFMVFPYKMQSLLTIIVGLVVTMAPTCGPVLGGYLTENISWHAMFLINIIPGILVCSSTWFFGHFDDPDWSLLNVIDFPGIFYISLFLGSLQYILEEGTRSQWFESREIIFVSFVSALSAIAFFYRSLTTTYPIVDIRAFKNQNFAIGSFFSFVLGWGLYSVVYLLPLYLGVIKGLNSLQIGYYMMVTGLFQLISAPLAALLSRLIDLRLIMLIGLTLFGLGIWIDGHITNDWGYWEFFIPQAVRGLSLMLCFLPINTIALGTLPPEQVKNASGLYNLTRNLGGAIGLAVANTCLQNWTKAHFAQLRESVTFGNTKAQVMIQNFTLQLETFENQDANVSALKMLNDLTQREANILAFNDVFIAIGCIYFVAILMIVFVKKVNPQTGSATAH